jgi:hypothetical protein
VIAAHADWSTDPRKRWMSVARRTRQGWRIGAPEPVGDTATLLDRLGPEAVLGVDFPVGVPRVYANLHAQEADFSTFLRGLRPEFFEVCRDLAEIAPGRPFYPARGVKGMTRDSHAEALGLGDRRGLSRLCDRATVERPAGAPVFWTLGANQSGKAAIAAWRDLLIPQIERIALWPFEGRIADLLGRNATVVAETYPAEALRHLGLRMNGSKRRHADRAALAPALLDRIGSMATPGLLAAARDGFGADAAGEDRLDCVLGVLCVIAVLDGRRPDFVPDDPWVRRWEGWVLGQTALPR